MESSTQANVRKAPTYRILIKKLLLSDVNMTYPYLSRYLLAFFSSSLSGLSSASGFVAPKSGDAGGGGASSLSWRRLVAHSSGESWNEIDSRNRKAKEHRATKSRSRIVSRERLFERENRILKFRSSGWGSIGLSLCSPKASKETERVCERSFGWEK